MMNIAPVISAETSRIKCLAMLTGLTSHKKRGVIVQKKEVVGPSGSRSSLKGEIPISGYQAILHHY